jgi:hypothetical protein
VRHRRYPASPGYGSDLPCAWSPRDGVALAALPAMWDSWLRRGAPCRRLLVDRCSPTAAVPCRRATTFSSILIAVAIWHPKSLPNRPGIATRALFNSALICSRLLNLQPYRLCAGTGTDVTREWDGSDPESDMALTHSSLAGRHTGPLGSVLWFGVLPVREYQDVPPVSGGHL